VHALPAGGGRRIVEKFAPPLDVGYMADFTPGTQSMMSIGCWSGFVVEQNLVGIDAVVLVFMLHKRQENNTKA